MRVGTLRKCVSATLISFFLLLDTLAPASLTYAQAGASAGTVSASTSLSTARFIAYATTSTSGPNPLSALVLSNSSGSQDFYIRNTGTLALLSLTIALSYSSSPGTTTFFRCSAGVSFTGSSCASGPTKVSVSQSGSVTLAFAANTWYAFQLNPTNKIVPTINVSVSSTQIRAPIITNS